MAEIRKRPRLWQGFLVVAFVMLAVGAGAVGLVVLGDERLGMGEEGFSILLAALAVGTFVGAVFIGRTDPTYPKGRLLVAASLLAGVMMVVLSRVEDVGLAMAVMVLIGVAASMVLVPFTTMLQEGLGDTVMGTGFGMLSMGLTTPLLIGVVIAGPFIEQRDVMELFVFMGLLLVVVGLVSAFGSNLRSREAA
jgi:predicted MFS family arabinose efflux permease